MGYNAAVLAWYMQKHEDISVPEFVKAMQICIVIYFENSWEECHTRLFVLIS